MMTPATIAIQQLPHVQCWIRVYILIVGLIQQQCRLEHCHRILEAVILVLLLLQHRPQGLMENCHHQRHLPIKTIRK